LPILNPEMIPAIGRRMTMLSSKNPITPLLLKLKRLVRIMIGVEDILIIIKFKITNNSIIFFNERCMFILLISIY
jgi:hypothetical protein